MLKIVRNECLFYRKKTKLAATINDDLLYDGQFECGGGLHRCRVSHGLCVDDVAQLVKQGVSALLVGALSLSKHFLKTRPLDLLQKQNV